MNQETYPLKKLIILNSGVNINIMNQKILLKYFENAIVNECIWVGNDKALIKMYGKILIKVIISNDKIISIIRLWKL